MTPRRVKWGRKMQCEAVKRFEVEEYSTETMWYRIVVKFRGNEVERFETPTKREAQQQFEQAGYKRCNDGL